MTPSVRARPTAPQATTGRATASAKFPDAVGRAPGDEPRLDRAGSWQRLRDAGEGRLIYRTEHGPRAIAVAYTVVNDLVLVRFPEFNEAAHYLVGEQVSIEVVSDDPGGQMWRIRISGYGEDLSPAQVRECGGASQLETWHPAMHTRTVGIRPLLVSAHPISARRVGPSQSAEGRHSSGPGAAEPTQAEGR